VKIPLIPVISVPYHTERGDHGKGEGIAGDFIEKMAKLFLPFFASLKSIKLVKGSGNNPITLCGKN